MHRFSGKRPRGPSRIRTTATDHKYRNQWAAIGDTPTLHMHQRDRHHQRQRRPPPAIIKRRQRRYPPLTAYPRPPSAEANHPPSTNWVNKSTVANGPPPLTMAIRRRHRRQWTPANGDRGSTANSKRRYHPTTTNGDHRKHTPPETHIATSTMADASLPAPLKAHRRQYLPSPAPTPHYPLVIFMDRKKTVGLPYKRERTLCIIMTSLDEV